MNSFFKFSSAFNLSVRGNLVSFTVNSSTLVEFICRELRAKNFIRGFHLFSENNFKKITIDLAYCDGRPVLKEIIPISKPGRKVYCSTKSLQILARRLRTSSKFHLAHQLFFLSTPYGYRSTYSAPSGDMSLGHIGGELLCYAVI